MTLFASSFAKPMNIHARLFLFDEPIINVLHFLFTFCFLRLFFMVIWKSLYTDEQLSL